MSAHLPRHHRDLRNDRDLRTDRDLRNHGGPRQHGSLGRRRGLRLTALGTALLLAAGACSFGEPDPDPAGRPPNLPTPSAGASQSGAAEVTVTEIATGLQVPWGVAFLPDGGALVTERDTARILQVGPESDADGLRVRTVATLDEVDAAGEGGLMGIAVSPGYERDQTVYIYYSTERDNRIARLRLGGEPEPIVTGIPLSGIHNGGRLGFGPDGFLYASTGDASERGLAQDPASLGGKILRMTGAGKPAKGNPTAGSLVWSLGHRNVQGFAWDAEGRMYATEFGQNTWDEVNLIKRGGNYGWPQVEGIGSGGGEFVDPIVQWGTSEASCSGAAMLERHFLAACLRGERIWMVETTAQGGVLGQPQELLTGEYGRLRTVVAAPDGSIWLTTSNHDGRGTPQPGDDRILRLVFGDSGTGRS